MRTVTEQTLRNARKRYRNGRQKGRPETDPRGYIDCLELLALHPSGAGEGGEDDELRLDARPFRTLSVENSFRLKDPEQQRTKAPRHTSRRSDDSSVNPHTPQWR